jgi:N-(2-amino-2-carboxyethyl)-L-glutamate synthase
MVNYELPLPHTTRPGVLDKVGNTPLVSIQLDDHQDIKLFVKLEAYNPTGSVKDRSAAYILRKLLDSGRIDKETTIIESTSGNFGVSLSAYCRYYGLKFIAVVDMNINAMNEMLIRSYGAKVIKIKEADDYGSFLLNRIAKVRELTESIRNSYWINQYENPLNADAYYFTLGKEICFQIDEIDYVFMGVSSGGTITGVSRKVKENFPRAKIIAVDVEGSVIFGNKPSKRFIPGIGSSMVPAILKDAYIDDVVITDEVSSIEACYELLESQCIFVGGSSGTVLAGIKKYFTVRPPDRPVHVVAVFPDRGERYFDTIYNREWRDKVINVKRLKTVI